MTETSAAFGRVDADGTVYVRTPNGERTVGSWQAGTPEEGLAHFARRYEDLLTEVTLLSQRLASGAAEPAATLQAAQRHLAGLETAPVVGDLAGLETRLQQIVADATVAAEKAKEVRLEARAAAIARKEQLVAEAESLAAESTQWRAAGERIRAILDEWKTIKGVDRKTDAELWRRYAAARDAFNRRRGSHFAGLDATRKEAVAAKEALIARAEVLADSTSWGDTSRALRTLMSEWKALPRGSREVEERLWQRFRGAQDRFFAARDAQQAEREAGWKLHAERKEQLLEQAEKIDLAAGVGKARARLKSILAEWEKAGPVSRDQGAVLDRRLTAVEEKIRGAESERWSVKAASEHPLLTQMREQVAKAEAQLARAESSGDERAIADARENLESKRQFLTLAEGAQQPRKHR